MLRGEVLPQVGHTGDEHSGGGVVVAALGILHHPAATRVSQLVGDEPPDVGRGLGEQHRSLPVVACLKDEGTYRLGEDHLIALRDEQPDARFPELGKLGV